MLMPRLAHALSEPVMGFLALAALVFGLAPELFTVSGRVHTALTAGEWIVVALFALEYAVHFAQAPAKRAYVLDPWRVLDLVIILAPLVTLIPGMPEAARSAPVLRVLRLVRAVLAGTRAGTRLRHQAALVARPPPQGAPVVTRLQTDDPREGGLDWDGLLGWLGGTPRGWVHASNLEPARVEEIARITRIPRALIDNALGDASYPRLEGGPKWVTFSLALPRSASGGRESLLMLIGEECVLSLTRYRTESRTPFVVPPPAPKAWPVRAALSVVRQALGRHEDIAGATERELRALEELPADQSPGDFFERTFALRKRIAGSKADLMRLRAILRSVAEGRRPFPGLRDEEREEFGRVADDADAAHETAEGIREALLSLLDLHLNVSGYGMNRFMRLLAIVSALALIPAVVGGLMGMNLVDNPWPATLGQVAFGTFVLMLCVLYTFLAKGWLK
jgi:hypothetical protein